MFLAKLLDPSLPPALLFYFALVYGPEMGAGRKLCPSPGHDATFFSAGLEEEALVSAVPGVQMEFGWHLGLVAVQGMRARQMWGAELLCGSPPSASCMSLPVALVNTLVRQEHALPSRINFRWSPTASTKLELFGRWERNLSWKTECEPSASPAPCCRSQCPEALK